MGGYIVAATGLVAEARIVEWARGASRPVRAVSCGGRADILATRLEAAVADGAIAVVSFGIAGGLAGGMRPGACVVAEAVVSPEGIRYETCPSWRRRLADALAPGAVCGAIAGVGKPVASCAEKLALHERTGALVADMESHVAARVALAASLPFAALRVVADPADRTLPPAALDGMRPDGSADIGAVLRSLAAQPRQLAGLLRVALDTRAALTALRHNRHRLGTALAFA